MVGLEITEEGTRILEAHAGMRSMLWLPGVDYEEVEYLANILQALFYRDRYALYDPLDSSLPFPPTKVKKLENWGWVRGSIVPEAEAWGRRSEFYRRHPELKRLLDGEDPR